MTDLVEAVIRVLAELLAELFSLTLVLLRLMTAPICFLISSKCRASTLATWKQTPWLPWLQIPLIIAAMTALSFLLPMWWGIFESLTAASPSTAAVREQTKVSAAEVKERLKEQGSRALERLKHETNERLKPKP